MNADEVKEFLETVRKDPSVVQSGRDEIDELLLGVIKIEKKYLYGLESASKSRRQEEIRKYLDKNMHKGLGG